MSANPAPFLTSARFEVGAGLRQTRAFWPPDGSACLQGVAADWAPPGCTILVECVPSKFVHMYEVPLKLLDLAQFYRLGPADECLAVTIRNDSCAAVQVDIGVSWRPLPSLPESR